MTNIKTLSGKLIFSAIFVIFILTTCYVTVNNFLRKENIIKDYAKKYLKLEKLSFGDKNLDYESDQEIHIKVDLLKKSLIRNYKIKNPDLIKEKINTILQRKPVLANITITLDDQSFVQKSDFLYYDQIEDLPPASSNDWGVELTRSDIKEIKWLHSYLINDSDYDSYVSVFINWDTVYAGSREFDQLEQSLLFDEAADFFFRNSDNVPEGVRLKWLFASL